MITTLQLDTYIFCSLYFINPVNKAAVLKQKYLMKDIAFARKKKRFKACE